MIELAKVNDLLQVVHNATLAREHMIENGLNQWQGDYPNLSHFQNDFDQKALYIYKKENNILGSISLFKDREAAYSKITWIKKHSLVMHRVIVSPIAQHQGIGTQLFTFAIDFAKNQGYESVKVDTHPDNSKMQNLILKMGFQYIGYLSGINRLAYEFIL